MPRQVVGRQAAEAPVVEVLGMSSDIQYRCVPAVKRDGTCGYVIQQRTFLDGEFWTDWETITRILDKQTADTCAAHLRTGERF